MSGKLNRTLTALLREDLSLRKGHIPEQYSCSWFADHNCPGPSVPHVGAFVTARWGADTQGYRIVWVNKDVPTQFCAIALTALYPEIDRARYDTRFSQSLLSIMCKVDGNGEWWVMGRQYVGKRPVTLGIGEIDHHPDV